MEKIRNLSELPTTVIITADHGENHGEKSAHGLVNHKSSLSEQLLHVPLEIINPPRGGNSTTEYVSLLDLPELILGMAENRWCDITRSVVPAEVIGLGSNLDIPDQYDAEFFSRGIRSACRNNTKVVWDSLGNAYKYHLNRHYSSDQDLLDNCSSVPDWAKSQFDSTIEDVVTTARASSTDESDVSDSAQSRLKELGYL
ncbi:hypothetical protein [Halorubrum sp. Ib24]|uniref:hypothetical protein n=1 Tax=Halorubrum sp. Ib24 TaxID=1383850 RepID=UPI00117A009F|nr:hypothetical protein [Halorubrum sp. Ib24]